jgi:hypothetical protein
VLAFYRTFFYGCDVHLYAFFPQTIIGIEKFRVLKIVGADNQGFHEIILLIFNQKNSSKLCFGWNNNKYVIARLDRAIQCLALWIPRSSRRMTTVVSLNYRYLAACCGVVHYPPLVKGIKGDFY